MGRVGNVDTSGCVVHMVARLVDRVFPFNIFLDVWAYVIGSRDR